MTSLFGTTTPPVGMIGYNAEGNVVPQARPGFGSNDPTLNSAVDIANMPRAAEPQGINMRATPGPSSLPQGAPGEGMVGATGLGSPGYVPSAPVGASQPGFYGR